MVSALGKQGGLELQQVLIDAAVEAGVKRFIPSEFGLDLRNPKVRDFPVYGNKVKIESHLENKCAASNMTYTLIYNNVLLEQAFATGTLDAEHRTVAFYDGGQTRFSLTTMATAARAVVEVLRNYESTADRAVRIQDISLTPRQMLDIAQRVAPADTWLSVFVDTGKLVKEAGAELIAGKFNPRVFGAFAVRGAFASGFGGCYSSADNELLGIPLMTQHELGQLIVQEINKGSADESR